MRYTGGEWNLTACPLEVLIAVKQAVNTGFVPILACGGTPSKAPAVPLPALSRSPISTAAGLWRGGAERTWSVRGTIAPGGPAQTGAYEVSP